MSWQIQLKAFISGNLLRSLFSRLFYSLLNVLIRFLQFFFSSRFSPSLLFLALCSILIPLYLLFVGLFDSFVCVFSSLCVDFLWFDAPSWLQSSSGGKYRRTHKKPSVGTRQTFFQFISLLWLFWLLCLSNREIVIVMGLYTLSAIHIITAAHSILSDFLLCLEHIEQSLAFWQSQKWY